MSADGRPQQRRLLVVDENGNETICICGLSGESSDKQSRASFGGLKASAAEFSSLSSSLQLAMCQFCLPEEEEKGADDAQSSQADK